MEAYGIGPCREISVIKESIKEAILDGKITNDYDSAIGLMSEIAETIGLKMVENFNCVVEKFRN